MNHEESITPLQQMISYLRQGKAQDAIDYLESHPEQLHYSDAATKSWLHEAADSGLLSLVDYLLRVGLDINYAAGIEQSTPLEKAVRADENPNRPDFIRELLRRGADPNISRPLISALLPRRGNEDVSLELVRILVEEGGADVNRIYDIYGDKNNTFTALEWAEAHDRPKIAAYLRSKGAVDRPPRPAPPPPPAKKKRK